MQAFQKIESSINNIKLYLSEVTYFIILNIQSKSKMNENNILDGKVIIVTGN